MTEQLETKYGLPSEVKFCQKCLYSNQVPNSSVEFMHTQDSKKTAVNIDENGVCDACNFASQKKDVIDWKARDAELRALCDKHRRTDGAYDCLVPGSGGKDSFYASYLLKYKYGMHPLTVTWAPNMYTKWGWQNFQAWINSGFDNYLFTPNGRTHRLLTRLAVENLFHPFQAFILGQKGFAIKLALKYELPLVFYGENDAEYNNPIADNSSAQRDWKYFSSEDQSHIYLGGVSITDLKEKYGLEQNDLLPYLPTNPEKIEKLGAEVHYLGYYTKWHPQECFYFAVENGGFQASPERTPGTYSKYNSIDDKIDDMHYYTTHIKFGIGRATYDAAQEVRSGDITREEGLALVKRYDGEFPDRFADEIFDYLSMNEKEFPVAYKMFEHPKMDREYFMKLADKFRSPHLWKKEDGEWKLRHTAYYE